MRKWREGGRWKGKDDRNLVIGKREGAYYISFLGTEKLFYCYWVYMSLWMVVFMKGSIKKWALILFTSFALVTFDTISLIIELSMTSQGDIIGDFPPSDDSEWIITQDTYVSNENITLHGNIIINDGGILTLDNTVLNINASNYGNAMIDVKNGGELNIINDSRINQGQTKINYDFWFENGSVGLIQNSTIRDCGWDDGQTGQSSNGILIESNDVIIENSTLTKNYIGIVALRSSPIINNNLIQDNRLYGVILINSSAQLTGNYISINPVGVISYFSEPTLLDNEIVDCGDGARFYFSHIHISGGKVSSNSPNDCSTGACSAEESGKGIYVSASNLSVKNVNISENSGGIIAIYSSLDVRSSLFLNNYDDGIMGEYSEIVLLNNIFTSNEDYAIRWRYTTFSVDETNEFIQNDGLGRAIVEWGVQINVTDSYGDKVAGANVQLDNDGDSDISQTTDPSGIVFVEVPEYEISNDGTPKNYNPFTVTASKTAPWDGVTYSNSTQIEVKDNYATDLRIPLVKPDLKVEEIGFSEDPRVEDEVKIKVIISNIGEARANNFMVIISQKNPLNKTFVIHNTTISLDPNNSTEISVSWTPETEGDSIIKVKIQTSYDEKDKANNLLEKNVNVKEKALLFYEEPYFMATLVSILIILLGIAIYTRTLKKKEVGEGEEPYDGDKGEFESGETEDHYEDEEGGMKSGESEVHHEGEKGGLESGDSEEHFGGEEGLIKDEKAKVQNEGEDVKHVEREG
ncbi:MAG: hypothetical protein JSW00_09870 [Thermoplasmata archaeon]|nr:MAG: hypothetical protein JSW00_09870 [Thermoplasmata archaeon]